MALIQLLTIWRNKTSSSIDGVPLYVVSALELDPIWRRNDGDGDTVPPTLLVSSGSGHQQQIFMFRLQTSLK